MTITTPDQVRQLRARHELTQRELADLLGTTETTVSRLENGAQAIDMRWSSHLTMLAERLAKRKYEF